jgi:hypothetical protein
MLAVLAIISASAAGAQALDPTGDTFGSGPAQIDIISAQALYNVTTIEFTFTFASLIAPASAGAINSLGGVIDLDTDQNPDTGVGSFLLLFGQAPAPALGDEFYVDLFSEANHAGFVELIDANTVATIANIAVAYTGNSLRFAIPLETLGDDGALNYGVLVGTMTEPTDEMPNGATPLTSVSASAAVPELNSLFLFCSGWLIYGGMARMRHTRSPRLVPVNSRV